jgi:hypothetical protein
VGIEVVGGEGDRRAREVEEELGRAPILPSESFEPVPIIVE